MPLLVGNTNATGISTAQSPLKQHCLAFKFTASATGKVTVLGAKKLVTALKYKAALCTEGEITTTPAKGTILAETGEVTKAELEAGVTVSAVEVKSGTAYWLIVWSAEAWKIERWTGAEGATASAVTSTENATGITNSVATGSWTAESHGPAVIFGEGSSGTTYVGTASAGAVVAAGVARTARAAGAASAGASASAAVARTARAVGGASAGASAAAVVARSARATAGLSSGASVAVGAIVKTERGPQAAKVSSGASVSAQLARLARAQAAASSGASVRAEVRRVAQVSARVSAGASATAPVRSLRSVAARVSGGAVVSSSARRLARVSAAVSAGAAVSAVRGRAPVLARVSGGVGVYATWTAIQGGGAIEPPTSTPVAGHVAIGQRGSIGVHRGSIPTGNIGRAER